MSSSVAIYIYIYMLGDDEASNVALGKSKLMSYPCLTVKEHMHAAFERNPIWRL